MSNVLNKVLIVDDSKATADTIEKNLQQMGLQTIAKETKGLDAISAVKNLEPDLILMDIDLEGSLDGIETMQKIRLFSDIPVIYMSVLVEEKVIRKITETDGEMFLSKPFNAQELAHAVEKTLSEAKLKKEALNNRYLVFHDPLTGLYSRAYFEEELKRYDQKRQLPLSILMADINALQLTREIFGEAEGDRMIQDAAKLLKRVCRSEDMVARWNKDEFIVLLPHTSAQEVEVIREAEETLQQNKLNAQEEGRMNLIELLEKRLRMEDSEKENHMSNLQYVLLQVMSDLNLDEKQADQLLLLAMYHDMGNILTDKNILNKKDPLTDEEWVAIKSHAETGFRIAMHFQDFSPISEYLLTHHEWWNGEGYPRGLQQEEIPLLARIFSIADAISAMMQKRTYREARPMAEIREELKKMSGKQFDPALTKVFLDSSLFNQHNDS